MSLWYGQVRITRDGGRRLVAKPENTVAARIRTRLLKDANGLPIAGITGPFVAEHHAQALVKFKRMVRDHATFSILWNRLVIEISPFMRRRQRAAQGWITIYEKWRRAAHDSDGSRKSSKRNKKK